MDAVELARRGLSEETMKKYGDPYEYTHPLVKGMREQIRSVWGFGGYYSNAIDAALRHDDPDGLVELMRAAGLDANTETFDGLSMDLYCRRRGALKCRKAVKVFQDQQTIRDLSAQRKEPA